MWRPGVDSRVGVWGWKTGRGGAVRWPALRCGSIVKGEQGRKDGREKEIERGEGVGGLGGGGGEKGREGERMYGEREKGRRG